MGGKHSAQQKDKFQFIDRKDIQQSHFNPVSQKTSLQPKKSRSSKQFQGPAEGQEGQYTGLAEFQVSNKYRNIMEQNPLKCPKTVNIKGSGIFDPYLFKKSLNVYYGEWKNGKPHGYGKLWNPDRDYFYEGYFEEGLPSCYGVFLAEENIQYRGQMKYGRAEGQGKYTEGKTTIEGSFKNNLPHQKCIQKGHHYRFEGDYQNGKWRKGKLQWNSQTCLYEGSFKQGMMHGQGMLKTLEYTYLGTFKEGKKYGKGELKWKSGQLYKGQFQNDDITGNGDLTSGQTPIFKGFFKNGKAHGIGHVFQNQKYIKAKYAEEQIIDLA